MNSPLVQFADAEILAARPPRNRVEPRRPYAFFVENERSGAGRIDPIATVFLTNRECPFRCLYCDLWKNTTEDAVAPGDIPAQIEYALERLPPARHIKLYNSGNFFDAKAIPPSDHARIAELVRSFETVVVENHPRLCTDACLRFRALLTPRLEIAIGLETVHPQILPALNKQMTIADFDAAVRFVSAHQIAVRSFVLLRTPGMTELEGIEWAVRSVQHAFSVGVACCTVIPVRGGNGIMEQLRERKLFHPPRLRSLEKTLEASLRIQKGRVFADLWDVGQLEHCPKCVEKRIERLRQMNLTQEIPEPVRCDCEESR